MSPKTERNHSVEFLAIKASYEMTLNTPKIKLLRV